MQNSSNIIHRSAGINGTIGTNGRYPVQDSVNSLDPVHPTDSLDHMVPLNVFDQMESMEPV